MENPGLTSYIEFRESEGYTVQRISVDYIETGGTGSDLPEKIRNTLINAVPPDGLSYMLILGSLDQVPNRKAYPDPADTDRWVYTDYYYCDLTGTWDSDGDGYAGEYGEDDPSEQITIISGRIPFDEPTIIQQVLERIVAYEQDQTSYKREILIGAARLFYQNDTSTMVNEVIEHTIIPGGYSETTYYTDQLGTYCDGQLDASSFLTAWNQQDYGVVFFTAHGAKTYVVLGPNPDMNDHFLELGIPPSVDKPALVLTSACGVNDPEVASLGKGYLETGVAVTFFGSSRTTTPDWEYVAINAQMEFLTYLLADGDTLGKATQRMLDYYTSRVNVPAALAGPAHFQNLYGFNIAGDPTIKP